MDIEMKKQTYMCIDKIKLLSFKLLGCILADSSGSGSREPVACPLLARTVACPSMKSVKLEFMRLTHSLSR